MQQINYVKIMFVMVVVCTIITLTIFTIFLGPMLMMGGFSSFLGGGPPGMLSDKEATPYYEEMYQLESVQVFKKTYPNFREDTVNQHQLVYTIQTRNENTGNILSLQVFLNFMGMPGQTENYNIAEHLRCIPSDEIVGPEMMMNYGPWNDSPDLFLHETIQSSNCLDDDYEPVVISSQP